MSGVGLQIHTDGALERFERRLARMSGVDFHDLLETVGATVESQTRRRIQVEKADAEGKPWPAWSPRYALTRHAGQSLLQGEGALLDSIQSLVSGEAVETGSNLIYFAVHQFGGEEVDLPIPARPPLGLSNDNFAELEGVLDDWLDGLMGAPA